MTNAFGVHTHKYTDLCTTNLVHYEKSRQCSKRSVFDEVAIKLANTGIKIANLEKYMSSADGLSSGLLR